MEMTTTKLPQKIDFVEFPEIKGKLQQLADDYKGLVVTNETFEQAKKARKTLRDERYAIARIEKSNTSLLNDIKKKNKDLASELISIILPVEEKIDEGVKAIEAQKAAEKRIREEEKARQLEAWRVEAQCILDYLDLIIEAETMDEVSKVKKDAENLKITEDNYGSFILVAEANKQRVLDKCDEVIARMKEKEKAEKLRLKELAKKKKEAEKKALIEAQVEYMTYFGIPASPDLSLKEIKYQIKKDTAEKLAKLKEIEEEKLRLAEEKEAEELKLEKNKPDEEIADHLPEAIKIPIDPKVKEDSVKNLGVWITQIGNAVDSKPEFRFTDYEITTALFNAKEQLKSILSALKRIHKNLQG